jgi:hypothetical protein
MTILARLVTTALLTLLLALAGSSLAGAMTLDQTAQQVTGISNSKWTIGDSGQTYGTNCSTAILGSSYPEIMEMAFSGYGGLAGSVRVGSSYWAMLHLAVTGNPCPKGSDIIFTDLTMPPGTSFDSSRQIKCFSTGRDGSNFYDSTNEGWDMRPIGINAYGRTCPTGPTPSSTGYGVGFDFRGLASGQHFVMYVPVKSTQNLIGAGNSEHRFVWLVNPSLAYNYFGTQTWANVFPNSSSSPYIYFTRQPSVVPFWKSDAPAGEQNLVEMFVNLYSDYKPGTFCYDLFAGATATGVPILHCVGFASTIDSSSDIWFAKGNGPNGGAVSFRFDPEDYGQTFTLRWYFTPSPSGPTIYSDPITFKALSGPDDDGDGIANDGTDQCPSDKGEAPTGCSKSLAMIADSDGDGVIGANDKCPTLGMIGATDGCPTLTAKFGKLPTFKRAKLAKGVTFPVSCSLASPVKANLTVSRSVAKKLKIKLAKGARSATIGSAKGSCKVSGGAKLKLKLSSKAKKPVTRSRKSISANLTVTFTPAGGVAPVTLAKSVKLR